MHKTIILKDFNLSANTFLNFNEDSLRIVRF